MPRRNRKSFLVIGLGRFGSSLAMELTRLGHEVLGIDRDMAIVEEFRDEIGEVMQMEASNPRAIIELAVGSFDTCIVATGSSLAESILITMHLRDMDAQRVVAKAVSEQHARVLEKVGADIVIFPERDMGRRIAHSLASSHLVDFFEIAPDVSVMEIAPPDSMLHKTLQELELRPRFGITVLGVKRDGQMDTNPLATTRILPGDDLLVMGQEAAVERLLGS